MKNKYEIRGEEVIIFLKRRDGSFLESVVDKHVLPKLLQFKGTWCASFAQNAFYVVSEVMNKGKRKKIYLHRYLLDDPEGYTIDHIDQNPLNNKRNNLRLATKGENGQNTSFYSTNTSGVKGVSWNKFAQKWEATFVVNKKRVRVGSFDNLEEAKQAIENKRAELMPYSPEARQALAGEEKKSE